ncbi:hypothetical protein ACIQ4I_02945 [Rummeliibacillus sp. NPDC094406]|uniref:hypothetical protein n=1 Tax=Rummeliibacillus sp. NPDC094406 TaxID=3364511 RepID=UPI003824972A
MPFYIGPIVGVVHFLLTYFIWKKGKVLILAGYVEGQVKDTKKLSKNAGMLILGAGIISVFFTLVPGNFYYFVFGLYFLWLLVGMVIVNIKVK